ncbi:MAG: type I restriction endonuclease subunit R, partial [Bacteroidales bacterium]|nr:type I restriction endonuclease subunit R [Bacteroidales bacterium]
MSYEYSENILVQESAGELLEKELGWEVAYAYNTEVLGADGTFGRRSYREVLLVRYFRRALKTLNPWITDAQIDEAQQKLESRLASASDMQINEEKYFLIRDGIKVTVKTPDGKTASRTARVVDFEHPEDMEKNHFLAIKELKIHGNLHRRRTDIVGFVNGIPLVFMEFKKNTVDV